MRDERIKELEELVKEKVYYLILLIFLFFNLS